MGVFKCDFECNECLLTLFIVYSGFEETMLDCGSVLNADSRVFVVTYVFVDDWHLFLHHFLCLYAFHIRLLKQLQLLALTYQSATTLS
jgi:hypothetical protein